jgi:hypothetical protein
VAVGAQGLERRGRGIAADHGRVHRTTQNANRGWGEYGFMLHGKFLEGRFNA